MSIESRKEELRRHPILALEWALGKVGPGAWRGIFWWLRSGGRWDAPVFVDAGVRILFLRKLHLGKFCSLGRFGYLNALSSQGVTFGRSVSIGERFWIQGSSQLSDLGISLSIEDNVYIGPGAVLGFHGPVTIGRGCAIGANFQIAAQNHDLSRKQGIGGSVIPSKGIRIGRECWIGNDVKVTDGVEIGDFVAIGAGAVVTRSLPSGVVAAGVPARVLRQRE